MNIQDSFPLRWTGWLSMQFKALSRVFSNITVQNHQFFGTLLSSQSNSHIHTWLLEKTIALTKWTFISKVMSLFLNMLSRLVIAFLPRSKHLLISWLQVTIYSDFGAHENKVCDCFHFVYPSIFHVVMGPDAMISVFWMLTFKPGFSLSSFTFTKRLFSSYLLLAKSLVVPQKVQHRITKTYQFHPWIYNQNNWNVFKQKLYMNIHSSGTSQMVPVVKNPYANTGDVRDMGLIPRLGRFPWRRKWQPTPVLLPGESHGQRSLEGYVHEVAKSQTRLK